jgi:hypothetical protein
LNRVGRFPTVVGTNLEGLTVHLPDQFSGRLNLLLIAFRQVQQADVDTWMPYAEALEARRPDVRAYELPVLSAAYRLARPFIDGGMRAAIPDPAVRRRTITLYLDKAAFRAALGVDGEDQIHVRLVDRSGTTHWRTEGAWDAASSAALDAVLAEASRMADEGG